MKRAVRALAAAMLLAVVLISGVQPALSLVQPVGGMIVGVVAPTFGQSCGPSEGGNKGDLLEVEGFTAGLNIWVFTVKGVRVGTTVPDNCSSPLVGVYAGIYDPLQGGTVQGAPGSLTIGATAGSLPLKAAWGGETSISGLVFKLGTTTTVSGTLVGSRLGGVIVTGS